MKISIEFDGCLWSHQRYFRDFMIAMQAAGYEVGILTGHSWTIQDADITLMQARGFPTPDFYHGMIDGEPRHSAEVKAEAILKYDIDMHYDSMDFGDPLAVGLFQRRLGPEFHRVMWVTGREPVDVHYE